MRKIFLYSYFVLLLFSHQVLDNKLKYTLAINALCLQGSLTKQRLQYFVLLEKERRRSREDLVVPSAISTDREGCDEDSTLLTETSPLTIASDESKSTTTTNSSGRKKSTRRSPRQASIARLDAKRNKMRRGNDTQWLSWRQQPYWQAIPSAKVRQPAKRIFDWMRSMVSPMKQRDLWRAHCTVPLQVEMQVRVLRRKDPAREFQMNWRRCVLCMPKFVKWEHLVNSEVAIWKGWLVLPPLVSTSKVNSLGNLCGGRYDVNSLISFRLLTNWVLTMLGRNGQLTRTSSCDSMMWSLISLRLVFALTKR